MKDKIFDWLKIEPVVHQRHNDVEAVAILEDCDVQDIIGNGNNLIAFWDDDKKEWRQSFGELCTYIDRKLTEYRDNNEVYRNGGYKVSKWADLSTNNAIRFKRDILPILSEASHFGPGDVNNKLTFATSETKKKDVALYRLPYDPIDIQTPAFDTFSERLYGEEINKVLWHMGCALCNDNMKNHKVMLIYGMPGSGKSSLLKIIKEVFKNYAEYVDIDRIADSTDKFALAQLKRNPSVGLCDEADLTRVNTNSILNKVFSHDELSINEKNQKAFNLDSRTLFFIGTNHPVNITDSNSGLTRRIVDVQPQGQNMFKPKEFEELMDRIMKTEIPGIAYKAIDIYKRCGAGYYNKYVSTAMKKFTDITYNFMVDWIDSSEMNATAIPIDSRYIPGRWISVKKVYKNCYMPYCSESGIKRIKSINEFKIDFGNYFSQTYDDPSSKRLKNDDDSTTFARGPWVKDLRIDKFEDSIAEKIPEFAPEKPVPDWLKLKEQKSVLDDILKDCLAQLGDEEKGTPKESWDYCKTTLKEIDTRALHYVMVQGDKQNHIVVDFDIADKDGKKDLMINIRKAIELGLPMTYAETSKSGGGLHLHYYYDGDIDMLERRWPGEDVEIKVYTGKSSLRRKLSICNDISPVHLAADVLPTRKEKKKVLSDSAIKNQDHLRNCIMKALRKEIEPGSTVVCVSYIKKVLDDAYESGIAYDVRDLQGKVLTFCMGSTNKKNECLAMFNTMNFCNIDVDMDVTEQPELPLAFYDIEVVPNLLLVEWMEDYDGAVVHKMFNPEPDELVKLWTTHRLVGYNNREYDNHIIYSRGRFGYSNEQMHKQSHILVKEKTFEVKKQATFGEAYGISYADIYDYYGDKSKRLKDWEIELGIDHLEWDMDWDKPLPEDEWERFAKYCENDVISTRAVWHATQGEFMARKILADLSGLTVMDKTNSHTQQIIFGSDRKPQSQFNYRDMGNVMSIDEARTEEILKESGIDISCPEFTKFDSNGMPVFPGYEFKLGKSIYRNFGEGEEDRTEGGYAKGNPNMYGRAWTFDVASMHPSTIKAEKLFGEKYTKRFEDILEARLAVKHKDIEKMKTILDGKLAKYADKPEMFKTIQKALKIAINSVYGLTSASFANRCRDPRNIDNIVAKRGALFMTNLENEVTAKGYKVIHIKTDSIKIADPDDYIINFVMNYGKLYGYNFEVEHKFDKICLVNNAVYIAQLSEDDDEWLEEKEKAEKEDNPIPTRWTATGKEFQIPYVFKKLFSGEDISFEDLCVKNKVSGGDIFIDFNEGYPDVSEFETLKELRNKFSQPYESVGSPTKKAKALMESYDYLSDEDIDNEIAKGHNYVFVGGVGQFCPVRDGYSRGDLIRITKEGKKQYVTGSKGYKWVESSNIKNDNWKSMIDYGYFDDLCKTAIEEISVYGDFYEFADKPFL